MTGVLRSRYCLESVFSIFLITTVVGNQETSGLVLL